MKKSKEKSLGDRMKEYEKASQFVLPKRMPIIMRLDGKAFHTFTRNFEKPYSHTLMEMMDNTALYLCENIQGAKVAYVQSDEITILIKYYDSLESEPWFNNELIKMCSVGAGLASSYFQKQLSIHIEYDMGGEYILPFTSVKDMPLVQFDCRAFVIPEDDVCNNFIWRQQDWERNSIQMFGLSMFSQKELDRLSCPKIIEKCEKEKGKKWSDLSTELRRGRCIVKTVDDQSAIYEGKTKWVVDKEIPIFKNDRDYIEKYLK